MAFHWEEGIEYARYIDEDRQNIEVMHIVDNPENIHGREAKLHVLPALDGDDQFKALLEHYTHDDIMEMTYRYNKDAEIAFEQQVMAIAQKQDMIDQKQFGLTSENFVKRLVEVMFVESGISEDDEKEMLFKTKLQLFELDKVKNHTDRTVKSKLRKAKSIQELFVHMFEWDAAIKAEAKTD